MTDRALNNIKAKTKVQCLAAARAVFEARVIAHRHHRDGPTDPDEELHALEMALYAEADRRGKR